MIIESKGHWKLYNIFSLSNRNDSDSDCDELSDGEISKLLIVTQTPNRPRKHEGFDRTGDFCSRVKLSQDLAQVINDGLSYYEVFNFDFSLYKPELTF